MGFGIANNWNMPYLGNWNMPAFGGLNNSFDFSNNIWTTPTSSTSTTATDNETYEQYKKRMEQEAKNATTSTENTELNAIKENKLKDLKIENTKKALQQTKTQVENGKKADGSSSTRTPYKKLSFWGKVGRWVSNAGTAIKNVAKQFVGFEKDGSWNWKKCLKNVGITALAVGACFIPVVGPVIGYGLAAGGVAMGGIGMAKGISELNNASENDDEAIDNAQQKIMIGAFVGITSACGLRGIGKGVSASNASTATVRNGIIGKAVEKTSQFGRDITINAWRATKESMLADKALIAAQSGGKVSSFFKAWGNKIGSAAKNTENIEEIYNSKYDNLKTSLERKMNEINSKLLSEKNASKRALLQEEKSMLEINLKEVNSLGNTIKTKADYDKLLKDNAGTFNKEYAGILENNLNGTSIATKRLARFNKSVAKFQKSYSKKLAELVKTKNKEMYLKASKPERFTSELNEFVPTRNAGKLIWKPSSWGQNEYQRAIGLQTNTKFGSIAKTALTHPATTAPKAFAIFDPIYSTPFGFGEDISSEQYEATLQSLDSQIKSYDELEKKIKDCKSVDELNALAKAIEQPSVSDTAGVEEKKEVA